MATNEAFTQAYASLNKEQKEAVDTVEGPVLVIAGPGTGKTHILTLRAAHILAKTDADASSILILTFTDSAARTVAKRLAGLIGEEEARKVGAFTFHSFAEDVLKNYPEAFPDYTDRRLMGELEQVLLWRRVLESKKVQYVATPKAPFHYLKDLMHLEDELTREHISLSDYGQWLDEEAGRIEADPAHRYVRGERTGEMKQSGIDRLERLLKGREAIELIEVYRKEKDEHGVYGYTDVLRIVVDALRRDEALRAEMQERYQYVLADEHQDANALQHALLDALAFDDHPNLFIVGDEKQAIFGFQGADTTHFKTFLEQYPRTKVIALSQNFRSYQDILDLSHTLLEHVPSATGEHVRLSSHRTGVGKMHVLAAEDALSEREQIAGLVGKAIAEGTAPEEIAVITMKNSTADLFALHLRARGVKALRAGAIDLAGRLPVRYLLALMHAVADANNGSALREALLAPWWNAPLKERALFLRQHRDYELREALHGAFPDIAGVIELLQHESSVMPPLSLLSRILADSGARAYLLSHPESVSEDIPLVRHIIMHIEDLVRSDPNATFAEVMERFLRAREHEVGNIKTSLTSREGHVTVITAHKAKGMEFERVFVASLTSGEWESRGRAALIPSMFDSAREKEEVARLFYVALTRAKNDIVLSYPLHTSEGKETKRFSLLPSGLPALVEDSDPLPVLHAEFNAPELVRELTLRYLKHDGLSPSAFNEYLTSPASFFSRRVLRLSEPETRAIAVGNAVHEGIAAYYKAAEHGEDKAHQALSRTLARSLLPRGDTFDALARHARKSLDAYLASELLSRETVAIEKSFTTTRTVDGKDVVLKGKVDAVFMIEAGECIVDFKTSSTLEKKETYERQLAFYDLLLRENGHSPAEARIVQITDDAVKEHAVALTRDTRRGFLETLEQVLAELVSGVWREAKEPSEYDDLLTLFT